MFDENLLKAMELPQVFLLVVRLIFPGFSLHDHVYGPALPCKARITFNTTGSFYMSNFV